MPQSLSVRNRCAKSIFHVLAQSAAMLAAALAGSGLAAQTVSLDNVPPIALTSSSTQSAVSIEPSTGNVIVRSSVGTLNQCTGVALVPTINSFSAAAGTVLPGGTISLSWSSSNTTSCTPSQGPGTQWPSFGTMSTSGSQQFAAPQTQGTITFQLTCTNGSTSDTRTTQVTVQQQTTGCPEIYPSGGDLGQFDGTLGNPWPAFNDKIRVVVVNNRYLSLSFTATASQTQFGTISTTGFPGDGDGNGVVSISPTPGCFNASIIGQRCVSAVSPFPGVSWTNGQSAFVCKLEPGGSYNVNMYFPDCPSGSCGRDFGNIQQLFNLEAPR